MLTERLQHVFVWPSESWGLEQVITKKKTEEEDGRKNWVLLDPVLTAG